MISRRWAHRVGAVLVGVVASAIVGAMGFAVAVYVWPGPTLIGPTRSASARMQDQNSLRQLAGLAAMQKELPLKDGAFDPYEFVRDGTITRANYVLLRSQRSGTGPTDAEIERGDYTNLPWERYRGDGRLEGPPFPLLWEGEPDEDGRRLVALSDGSARYMEEAEFAALRGR